MHRDGGGRFVGRSLLRARVIYAAVRLRLRLTVRDNGRELRAASDPVFFEQLAHVALYRAQAYAEFGGDFLVGPAGDRELQHGPLSRSERIAGGAGLCGGFGRGRGRQGARGGQRFQERDKIPGS